jgi:hypothetical protein
MPHHQPARRRLLAGIAAFGATGTTLAQSIAFTPNAR